MNFRHLLCLGILLIGPIALPAQPDARELEEVVPRNIHWGLDLLRRDAYDDAQQQIFAGSRVPATNLAASFRSFREQNGQYQGFTVVTSQTITPRLRIFYVALEYEKAPCFLKFVVYRTPDGWVLLTQPEQPGLSEFVTPPAYRTPSQ